MPLPWVDLGHAQPLYDPAFRWPLSEPSGDFKDWGGRGGKSPGRVAGTLARNPVAAPGWLPGCVGFTGAGYVDIWNGHIQGMLTQYGLSIAFWVRRTADIVAANQMQQICTGGDWAWSMMVGHHGSLPYSRGNAFSFGYINVNGFWENSPDPVDLPLNTWWHYVCTWDGYRMGIDRNGVDIVSNSGIPLPKAPTGAMIGTYPDGSSYRANALQVADLRIYPYRLFENESLALYQSYFSSPARPWVKAGEPGSLVLHWTMEQAGGRNIRDSAGNAVGGNWGGGSFAAGPKPGMAAYAINGANEYSAFKAAPPLQNISGAFTVAAWAYPTQSRTTYAGLITRAYTGHPSIIALGYGASANDPVHAPNRFCVGIYNGGWSGVADTVDAPLNTWTHVAATYDGATLRLYRNGALVSSVASAAPPTSGNDWFIGKRWDGTGYFPGRISDVRVYDQTLDAASIQSIYDRASAVARPWVPLGVVT